MKVSMSRFYSREELVCQRRVWKAEGKRVVFTNGCYDILHPGHIRLLEQARSLGDVLILALNTDSSVQRLKGPSRPFFNQDQRSRLALQIEAVDAVTLFDEDTPRELIAEVLPDVLVKGADWSHFIAGREEVEAAGGQCARCRWNPAFRRRTSWKRFCNATQRELLANTVTHPAIRDLFLSATKPASFRSSCASLSGVTWPHFPFPGLIRIGEGAVPGLVVAGTRAPAAGHCRWQQRSRGPAGS